MNGELIKEVVELFKSLRPRTKSVKIGSLREGSLERSLLDGGATRVLRTARSVEEFRDAVPIQVELAAGEVTLRQDPATGTKAIFSRKGGFGTIPSTLARGARRSPTF